MKFIFYTKNINQRLYKRAIRVFLYETLRGTDTKYTNIVNDLVIVIYPSTEASNDPHFHGQDGVGGITGIDKVTLYLEDKETKEHDSFMRVFRKNMIATTHELCHHILIKKGFNFRIPLRHDDFSGHKKGTSLVASTSYVHDRHSEKMFFIKRFWFWDWWSFRARRMLMQCLDIRDLL